MPIAAPSSGNNPRIVFKNAHLRIKPGTSRSSLARRASSSALIAMPSFPSLSTLSSRVARASSRAFVDSINTSVYGTMANVAAAAAKYSWANLPAPLGLRPPGEWRSVQARKVYARADPAAREGKINLPLS